MNRQIKFRGKNKTGQWVYGSLVTHPTGKQFIIKYATSGSPEWHEVDPYTVGQYTGLDDTDGNPIFADDIVATAKYLGTVAWMPGKACYQIKPYGIYLTGSLKVIGNIHDNKKGGEK